MSATCRIAHLDRAQEPFHRIVMKPSHELVPGRGVILKQNDGTTHGIAGQHSDTLHIVK